MNQLLIDVVYDVVDVQSGKTYCAAFCASPVAQLAGSGYNARCHQLVVVCNGLATVGNSSRLNNVREEVARLIYLYLSKHEIFSTFTVRKKSLRCLLRSSLVAYILSGLLINMQ